MIIEDIFWNASIEETKAGYVFGSENQIYTCIICGEQFTKGIIYKTGDIMMDAELAVKTHIKTEHTSPLSYLLSLGKKQSGLTEIQKEIVNMTATGYPDAEIAKKLGNKAKSTVRNHRFHLREKYKEAKVFIAVMELLNETAAAKEERFINFPARLPVHDERIIVTEKERDEIIGKYFENGKLLSFPKKEKKKLVILRQIAEMFQVNRKYTGKELNALLEPVFPDYATIRRYLIEYGFLDRTPDNRLYWIRE